MRIPNESKGLLLGPGIDIKGDGGLVVAPGSLHKSGKRYEWERSGDPEDVPIAMAPEWMLARLTGQKSAGTTRQIAKKRDKKDPIPGRTIPEGQRHARLLNKATHLRDRWVSADETGEILWAMNQAMCTPEPLPDAEVEEIVLWVYSKPKRPSRKPGPSPLAERLLQWLKDRCGEAGRTFKIREIARGVGASVRQTGHCLRQLEEWDKLEIKGGRGRACLYRPIESDGSSSAVDRKGLGLFSSLRPDLFLSLPEGLLSTEENPPGPPLKRRSLDNAFLLPISAGAILH